MRRGALLFLIATGVLLVVTGRASWLRRDRVPAILAENERLVAEMRAALMALDDRRPSLGTARRTGDARAVYDEVLPRLAAFDDRLRDAAWWMQGETFVDRPSEAEVGQLLEGTAPLLRRLRSALTAPRMSIADAGGAEADPSFDYIGWWQALGYATSIHVWTLVRSGNVHDALDLCALRWFAGLDLARHAIVIDALVGIGLARQSAEAMRWILAHCAVSAERLDRLAEELELLRAATPSMQAAWRIEELWLRRSLRHEVSQHGWIGRRLWSDALARLRPTREAIERAVRGETGQAAAKRATALVHALPRAQAVLGSIFVLYGPTLRQEASTRLDTELLRVTVALARHRARRGSFPDDLAALAPALLPQVPPCPYSGEPLRYASGRVWSIGGDGDDDGGTASLEDYDIDAEGDRVYTLHDEHLGAFPWGEDVEPTTRARVESALRDLHRGGREGREAEDALVEMDEPIAGRLVSEFARIADSPGFDAADGRAQAASIDVVLRRRDGFMDRRWGEPRRVRAASPPAFVRTIALRWCNWWTSGTWRSGPLEPVDEDE